MKNCPSCQIQVGEPFEYCPLCQNSLEQLSQSDNIQSEQYPYYPGYTKVKVISMFFRVQLFVVISICIIVAAIDYMFEGNIGIHWSFIMIVWAIAAEIVIAPLFRRRTIPASYVTNIALIVTVAALITAKYLNGLFVCTYYQIPIVILMTLVFNFIYALVDNEGNALIFAICNVLVGVIPPTIMLAVYGTAPVMWKICFIVSVISLVGLLVFKGTKVITEVQKRLNI